jgi:micrococcal nuclease
VKQRFLAGVIFLLVFLGSFALLSNLTNGSKRSVPAASPSADSLVSRNGSSVGTSSASKENNQTVNSRDVLVTRVVDGDTIEIEGGQKVRYIGIDTPEIADPRKPVQCFAKEASNKNKELVEGKRVRLEKDVSETDKYGRLLRYVYVGDTFVNEILVKEGYAFSSTYPPDVKYQSLFQAAEKEAQQAGRGLWGTCGLVAGTKTTGPATDCVIKGNISSSGEKIYHLPGQRYYNQTVIDESKGERWFCSEEEAQAAGWRKSKI